MRRLPIDSQQHGKGRAVVLTSPLCRRLPPPSGLENGAASVGDDGMSAGVNRVSRDGSRRSRRSGSRRHAARAVSRPPSIILDDFTRLAK